LARLAYGATENPPRSVSRMDRAWVGYSPRSVPIYLAVFVQVVESDLPLSSTNSRKADTE